MAATKLFGKDLKEYADLDLDELLSKLTEEELEELASEIDPDDAYLPAAERCKDQTKKAPTGNYDRDALLYYLEKKASEEKDWENVKPYVKETKGKVWKPKEVKEEKQIEDISTEFDDILDGATDEELVDLAAILGFTGMMNQVQYHEAIVNQNSVGASGGFSSIAKYSKTKLVPNEPPNDTDVDESIDKLKSNDPKLEHLNLNNIKNISAEKFQNLFEAMKDNTHLTSFTMANTNTNDKMVEPLLETIKANKTLNVLNIESNFFTGNMIIQFLEAINVNKTITEFRASNQRQRVLGVKTEMALAKLICENEKILNVGIDFSIRTARISVTQHLKTVSDIQLRQKRLGLTSDS